MAKRHPGMGLEPNELPEIQVNVPMPEVQPPKAEVPRPRQDAKRPVCSIHHRQMVAYSSDAMYTRYRCPEPKCRETDKRVRPIGQLKNLYGNGIQAETEAE